MKKTLFFILIVSSILTSCTDKKGNNPIEIQQNVQNTVTTAPALPRQKTGAPDEVVSEDFIAGYSIEKRELIITRVGTGKKRAIVLIGCVHGEEENTEALVRKLRNKYKANPSLIPNTHTLFFMPLFNPDGFAQRKRENARGVDLNHNFPTKDWQADAMGMHKVIPGLGGTAPGSEPEVQALTSLLIKDILQLYESVWVLAFHSACPPTGYIQPGYFKNGDPDPKSAKIAEKAAGFAGYKYLHSYEGKIPITGELIHFCVMNNIIAMDVEFPTYDLPEIIPQGKKESTMVSHERMIAKLIEIDD